MRRDGRVVVCQSCPQLDHICIELLCYFKQQCLAIVSLAITRTKFNTSGMMSLQGCRETSLE